MGTVVVPEKPSVAGLAKVGHPARNAMHELTPL